MIINISSTTDLVINNNALNLHHNWSPERAMTFSKNLVINESGNKNSDAIFGPILMVTLYLLGRQLR